MPDNPYASRKYNTKKRFCSYWHQIDELLAPGPGSILEIGKGNGFLCDYLKKAGSKVTTVDIDPAVEPDYTASVTDLPFDDKSYDYIACFEVLEHLPFDQVAQALSELKRIALQKIIISLPDKSKSYYMRWKLPLFGHVQFLIQGIRFFFDKKPKLSSVHEWEIGLKEYPLKRITSLIREQGLIVEKNYRVFENPRHRFFVCRPG